jgi:pilus assembly protein CpaB
VKRRVLTVVLALLLAVVGTGAVLAYVRQADKRALAGQRAVSVLVAGRLIPTGTAAGTALRDGLLTSQELPAASVPPDALRSITGNLGGLVLSATVQPGQLLLRPMLVTAVQVTHSGLAIPAGMVAVTVNLCMPEAVAGNVHAGSVVEVFDTSGASDNSMTGGYGCSPPHVQQAYGSAHTRVLLPKVQVLSVGQATTSGQASGQSTTAAQSTSGTSSSSSSSSDVLVTVAVSQANAQRLILVLQTGLPYLALLADSSQTSVDTAVAPQPGQRPPAKSPGKP